MTKNINRIEKHRQGTSADGNQLDGLANAELKKQNVTIDYLVNDWLHLHNLHLDTVRGVLTKRQNVFELSQPYHEYPKNNISTRLTAENAWRLAAESLSRQLPNLKPEISQVSQGCKRSFFASPYNPPYTLIENDSDFPTIFMSFNGSAADILCVAHEFGHALQLYLASDHFIPPLHREIAAFLAEHIFLEYIEEIRPDLSIDIRVAWDLDNRIYFENDIELLLEALKTPHITKYNYRHNYPLARSIAENIIKTASTDDMSIIFRGNPEAIKMFVNAQLFDGEKEMQNYLPEAPEPDQNHPAINAYRSLGMMALLDIDNWQGVSEKTIEEYYATRLAHMQSQTALVAIGKERKPVGYAVWDIDQTDTNIIRLQRQTAPFGHYLELQVKLQARLPKNTKVLSYHSRSAREEQVAW